MLVSLEVFNALLFRINLAPMVFCFVLNTVFSESYPRPSGEVLSNQLRGLVFDCCWPSWLGRGLPQGVRDERRAGALASREPASDGEAAGGRLDVAQIHLVRACLAV